MVIDDDDVDPARPHVRERRVIGGPAVAGDQQARTGCDDALHRRWRHAVAPVEAAREQGHDLAAHRPAELGHDGRGRDAVAVVVAEDADPLASLHCTDNPLGSQRAIGHPVRRRQVGQLRLEEPLRRTRLEVAATVQEVRDGSGERQRASELARRIARRWRKRSQGRVGRHAAAIFGAPDLDCQRRQAVADAFLLERAAFLPLRFLPTLAKKSLSSHSVSGSAT